MKFHPEAAAFCLAWLALAVVGIVLEGWIAGTLIGIGLLIILGPTTATILSRTNDFALERTVRWSILIGAGALLALVNAVGNN